MHPKILERKLLDMVEEDAGFYDITTVFTPNKKVDAEIIAKESGIVAGIYELSILFDLFNVKIKDKKEDGDEVNPGEIVFNLEGNSHDILLVERTVLNILGRMSGITTITHEFLTDAREVNPEVKVASTRKTTPGFRYFEKKAVLVGGGDTHRLRLDDSVLIKDNHLKLFPNIKEAIKKAKENTSFSHKIEIEIDKVDDAITAAEAGADIIMLDNMEAKDVRDVVSELKRKGLRDKVLLEVSGRITLDNIKDYAPGVDVVSVGKLTHSSKALDFSLRLND